MIHYIITGGMGFVGSAFVKKLLDENDKVTLIVRNRFRAEKQWGKNIDLIERDLADIGTLILPPCSEGEERILVHFAWEGTSGEKRAQEITQLNNVRLSCELMRKSKEWGVKRFVNAGSIMEYEAVKTISLDGSHPQKNSIYSIAKLSTNYLLKTIASDIEMEYINVIISNVYGPGEHSFRFLNSVVRAMVRGDDLRLTEGYQLYDFIYITDAMNMIKGVAERGEPFESYYIGHEEQYPLREFVERAKKVVGSTSRLLFGEIPFAGQALEYSEFATDKLKTLGIVPKVEFEDGVRLMVKWIQENE